MAAAFAVGDAESSFAHLPDLSREARILLLCAGGPRADDQLRTLFAGEVDWLRLAHMARDENAVPVIWSRIARICDGAIPPGARVLEQVAVFTEFHLLATERALIRTVRALHATGIEATLIKGAAVATAVYGGITDRPMGDLDILVGRDRLFDARETAVRSGWTWSGEARVDAVYAAHHHLPPLVSTLDDEVMLELHSDIFPAGHPFAFEARDVVAGARVIRLGGVPVRVPRLEHLLLHACMHFVWSNQMRSGAWRTLRDVTTIVEAHPLDWDAFTADAQLARAGTACYWTLRFASRLLGAPVPADVLRALRPKRAERLLSRLERLFTYELVPTESICPSHAVFQAMWTLGVQPRASGHGRTRPWHVSKELAEAFPVTREANARRGLSERITYHAARVGHWARYFWSLLSPPASLP